MWFGVYDFMSLYWLHFNNQQIFEVDLRNLILKLTFVEKQKKNIGHILDNDHVHAKQIIISAAETYNIFIY